MQNRKNIGYDETKKMLNALRNLNETIRINKILTEQETSTLSDVDKEIDVINDVDIKILSSDKMDMKLSDEHKNAISGLIDSFRQQVSEIAIMEPGITLNTNQIRLDGSISNLDLSFVLISGEESGFYINADMLKIENEILVSIDKLAKFHLVFEDTMNPIIRERSNN